jgi:hypothetical protein
MQWVMKPFSHLFLGLATVNLAVTLTLISCDKQSQANANKNPAARPAQGGVSVPPGSTPKAAEGTLSVGSPGGAPAGGVGVKDPHANEPPTNPAAANTPAGANVK